MGSGWLWWYWRYQLRPGRGKAPFGALSTPNGAFRFVEHAERRLRRVEPTERRVWCVEPVWRAKPAARAGRAAPGIAEWAVLALPCLAGAGQALRARCP